MRFPTSFRFPGLRWLNLIKGGGWLSHPLLPSSVRGELVGFITGRRHATEPIGERILFPFRTVLDLELTVSNEVAGETSYV